MKGFVLGWSRSSTYLAVLGVVGCSVQFRIVLTRATDGESIGSAWWFDSKGTTCLGMKKTGSKALAFRHASRMVRLRVAKSLEVHREILASGVVPGADPAFCLCASGGREG